MMEVTKGAFTFFPEKDYPHGDPCANGLGHTVMKFGGVKGVAIYDLPPGALRVVPKDVTWQRKCTTHATTVGAKELYPGDMAASFEQVSSEYNDNLKSFLLARQAQAESEKGQETLQDDLLIARIARRVTRTCLHELGLVKKGVQSFEGGAGDDIEVMSMASGRSQRTGAARPGRPGHPGPARDASDSGDESKAASAREGQGSDGETEEDNACDYELDQTQAASCTDLMMDTAKTKTRALARQRGQRGAGAAARRAAPAARAQTTRHLNQRQRQGQRQQRHRQRQRWWLIQSSWT